MVSEASPTSRRSQKRFGYIVLPISRSRGPVLGKYSQSVKLTRSDQEDPTWTDTQPSLQPHKEKPPTQ